MANSETNFSDGWDEDLYDLDLYEEEDSEEDSEEDLKEDLEGDSEED